MATKKKILITNPSAGGSTKPRAPTSDKDPDSPNFKPPTSKKTTGYNPNIANKLGAKPLPPSVDKALTGTPTALETGMSIVPEQQPAKKGGLTDEIVNLGTLAMTPKKGEGFQPTAMNLLKVGATGSMGGMGTTGLGGGAKAVVSAAKGIAGVAKKLMTREEAINELTTFFKGIGRTKPILESDIIGLMNEVNVERTAAQAGMGKTLAVEAGKAGEATFGGAYEYAKPAAKGVVGVAKKSITAVSKFLERIGMKRQEASVNRIANVFMKNPDDVMKAVEKMAYKQTVADVVKQISVKSLAKTMRNVALMGAGGVATADVMWQWYAVDNVMTGQKFYLQDILKGVQSGEIDPQRALKLADDSQLVRDIAINKVKFSNSINPLMWAFRKLIITGAEADETSIQLITERISNAAAKTAGTGAGAGIGSGTATQWAQYTEEKAASEQENIDYYNNQRKIMLQWEREAAKDARNEDAKFWREEQRKSYEAEAKEREKIAEFWKQYAIEQMKQRENEAPSNLKFGLL